MPAEVSGQPTAEFRPEGAEIQDEQRAAAVAGEPPFATAKRGSGNRIVTSLRDSLVAAVVSLALFGPLVGLQTVPGNGDRLTVNQRWGLVAAIVAAVFVARLALNLLVWRTDYPITAGFARIFSRTERMHAADWIIVAVVAAILVVLNYFATELAALLVIVATIVFVVLVGRKVFAAAIPDLPYAQIFGGLFLVVAVALPLIVTGLLPDQLRYVMDQAVVMLTYIMLGWGLNIVVGYAGLLDLGYVAFYAVGAYSFALIAHYFGLSFWVCLPFAGILAATWGLILGFPVLRLRGDYLAIVTIAFGEIVRLILLNWNTFTGGPNGISNIPRPSFFGLPFDASDHGFAAFFGLEFSPIHRIIWLYYIILVLALFTGAVTSRLRRLPIGRAWEALREDEIACRSLGINTRNTKLTAFACGAMFAGFAGSFFATRQGFISPESFNSLESIIILAVVVLGGLGSQLGIVIAVIFLNTVFELRQFQDYRMLIVGLSMVLIMVWRPRGLISTRRPSVLLHAPKKMPSAAVPAGGHG
jgi:branched-chain amino acid transport system permease protein